LNFRKQNNKNQHELYYILNWESASKKRKSYEIGYYKEIKSKSTQLLSQVYATEHLNFLFGVEGKTLNQLKIIFEDLDETNQNKLAEVIRKWIKEYRENRELEVLNTNNNYGELVLALINSIGDAIGDATKSRYRISFDEVGKKYFLKSRGSLSFVGNITKDFLLFLTTISVKDNRIKVKELFNRFEKRGIYLDRYSKKEALGFLNKLNVLDKKSDSGDAQYVKTIL
jgi:DNA phosphorothioation-dependent restriction protein DptG